MPNLVAVLTFNPPQVRLMGTTLREQTIKELDSRLDKMPTTSVSPKQQPPNFEYVPNPPHWCYSIDQHYCDHMGRSNFMLTVVEALEAEDWRMKGTHAVSHNSHIWKSADAGKDTTRMFFTRA
eukprot:NODE_6545_length_524_cov_12.869018_g6380_i0.p1 GENE.NODE_6545_length_524_cov_12.869018_g6380_i0~~NODE_6545_length_524_cov_12.869018_g6380_i0.p1  ORF type:complete len:144 (+),score=45.40 NODE_6545_length_524_cov_12.869018_g6380_i0:65-433(+)